MGRIRRNRHIAVAVVCVVAAALSAGAGAQVVASQRPRPYVKDVAFAYGPAEFDVEGQYVLRVLLANMAAGGQVRICVSGVCRKARPRTGSS